MQQSFSCDWDGSMGRMRVRCANCQKVCDDGDAYARKPCRGDVTDRHPTEALDTTDVAIGQLKNAWPLVSCVPDFVGGDLMYRASAGSRTNLCASAIGVGVAGSFRLRVSCRNHRALNDRYRCPAINWANSSAPTWSR